jgi:hypothetical protein
MLEPKLIRTGLFAGCVLSVALLTSLAAMELASFVLTIATVGIFIIDARSNLNAAVARLQCPATIPLCGFSVLTLISLAINTDDTSEYWSAVRDQRWIIYFFVYLYFLQRFFSASWRLAVTIFAVALTVVATFALLQFFYGWELPREQSVLDKWDEYYRVTGLFKGSWLQLSRRRVLRVLGQILKAPPL